MKSIFIKVQAVIRVIMLVIMTIPIFIFQPFALLTPGWRIWFFPRMWHKTACKLCGIKIIKTGKNVADLYPNAAIVYASNHSSHLDIPVHGSWLKGMFVAKSDIASWPIFGTLAKLQASVFVERRPSAARKQKEHLQELIQKRARLVIFPEGTTSNGYNLLPFKSSLFGALIDQASLSQKKVMVQPVSLFYTHIDGQPIKDQATRDIVAWYGEMSLLPHLWRLFHHSKIKAHIHFHEPLDPSLIQDRKELSRLCHQAILTEKEKSIR